MFNVGCFSADPLMFLSTLKLYILYCWVVTCECDNVPVMVATARQKRRFHLVKTSAGEARWKCRVGLSLGVSKQPFPLVV